MIETLTRAELLEQIIQSKKSIHRNDAEPVIDRFFSLISQTLGRGEVVRMSGFGNFLLLDKKERPGRNPKTGEVIPVTARRVVTFRPGNKLKDLIDGFTQVSLNQGESKPAVKPKEKALEVVE
ncbi:MAG: integration host factor subunit alpha [Pseudomonadota bacterium]|nr:integration host factor subunit alpha [Pseudomonadota bacterium]